MEPNQTMVELKLHYGSIYGDYGVNTLWYLPDTSPTGSPFDIAKNFIAAWRTANLPSYIAALSSDVQIIAETARVLGGSGGGPSAEHPDGSSGSLSSMQLSFADSALIRYFGTGSAEEEVKTYLPGIPGGSWVNELPTVAYQNLINAIITAETTPIPLSSANFQRAGWKRSTGVPYQVSEGILRSKVCFLRRRLLPNFAL